MIEMAEPCETKGIVEDGNCLFRALTYSVSRSEHEHRKCRLCVVNYIYQNKQKYTISMLKYSTNKLQTIFEKLWFCKIQRK